MRKMGRAMKLRNIPIQKFPGIQIFSESSLAVISWEVKGFVKSTMNACGGTTFHLHSQAFASTVGGKKLRWFHPQPCVRVRKATAPSMQSQPNDLSSFYDTIAEKVDIWGKCPVSCGECLDCQHNIRFVDEQGFKCDDWIGLDCSLATSTLGYSEAGMQAVRLNCECACLNNDRSARNALKSFDRSTNSDVRLKCSQCRAGYYSSHDMNVNTTCSLCENGQFSEC